MSTALLEWMETRWRMTELVETLLSADACDVVATWLGDYRFLDSQGDPAMLSLSETGQPEFRQLVQQTSQCLEVNRILMELTRLGLVEQVDTGHVMLRRSAYGPGNAGPVESERSVRAAWDRLATRHIDINRRSNPPVKNKEKHS